MDTQTVIAGVGLIFGGGGVGALVQAFLVSKRIDVDKDKVSIDKDKADHDYIQRGFELAVKVVTNQRDDALDMMKSMQRRMDDMELEIAGLKLSNGFDPFPRWMQDLEGRFLFFNASFEEKYLFPQNMRRRDVIGAGVDVIWPEPFVRKLQELDAVARARPDGRARAVFNLTLGGELAEEITVYKFPVKIHGVIVAYAGYAMEMN